MKRYLLWYNKKHFGKIITVCHDTIFIDAKSALHVGEDMRIKGECLDYNYSIVIAPELKVPEAV